MNGLTVACVFAKGHVPFTAEYVVRLKSMAARTLPEHRFVCLTDRATELPEDIDTVLIPSVPRGVYGWWSKVHVFNPKLGLTGRVLYLDLDVLLVGDMLPIVNFEAPFALVPDGAPDFKPSNGLRVVKRFNSSVMIFNAGSHADIFQTFKPSVPKQLWGDQDWIGTLHPHATAMPAGWFPRLSAVKAPPWPPEAKVILCKKPKNAEAAIKLGWFNEAWQ